MILVFSIIFGGCSKIGSPSNAGPGKVEIPPVDPPVDPPPSDSWRSSLYPENWSPGFKDSLGRGLADFSYAGYHAGAIPIPANVSGPRVDVTQAPYLADATGVADSTAAIQRAIDDVSNAGGGTVFLPGGIFRVLPSPDRGYALIIKSSRVLLKGAGAGQTFIFNDETSMREKDVIRVSPDPINKFSWHWLSGQSVTLSQDLREPTKVIPVADISGFSAGEWILVLADTTDAFVADHGMTGRWPAGSMGSLLFYRKIVAIDQAAGALTIDSPIRYYLLRRDGARVMKTRAHLEEVGLEDFSIGMRQVQKSALRDNDYNVPGTISYQVHQSHAIVINHTVNSWVRRVNSYRPASNGDDVHILSNSLQLSMSKNITVDSCDFRKALYQGAGGNGYHFIHQGQDNLIVNSNAEDGRHNYDFAGIETSGNVILSSRSLRGRLPSDFHMYLSPVNLVDSMTLDADYFQSIYRDTATPKHGYSTTQSVYWNTKGLNPKNSFKFNFVIETQQYGWGYVIGTSGKTDRVQVLNGQGAEPTDFVEGVGVGEKLSPASLYRDQLRLRLGTSAVP